MNNLNQILVASVLLGISTFTVAASNNSNTVGSNSSNSVTTSASANIENSNEEVYGESNDLYDTGDIKADEDENKD